MNPSPRLPLSASFASLPLPLALAIAATTPPPRALAANEFLHLLRPGLIVHVRTYTPMGSLIRWALTKWIRRIARAQNIPNPDRLEVWASHDGLIVRNLITGALAIGEAEMVGGAQITSAEKYAARIRSGKCSVRLFEVVGVSPLQAAQASAQWYTGEQGHAYNWLGFPRLLVKALLFDLSDSSWKWLRRLGDKAAGWKWADWCTQGVADSWRADPPALDPWQTANPTPLTTEQVAGLLPRKPGKRLTLSELHP
jgi:hypothetical protein